MILEFTEALAIFFFMCVLNDVTDVLIAGHTWVLLQYSSGLLEDSCPGHQVTFGLLVVFLIKRTSINTPCP